MAGEGIQPDWQEEFDQLTRQTAVPFVHPEDARLARDAEVAKNTGDASPEPEPQTLTRRVRAFAGKILEDYGVSRIKDPLPPLGG